MPRIARPGLGCGRWRGDWRECCVAKCDMIHVLRLDQHHSTQGKPIEPNGKSNRSNSTGQCMANQWPVHGQSISNS
eukprot:10858313-Lingulodinium_polyedra.AAC.1